MQVQDSIPFSIGFSTNDSAISAGPNGVLFPRGQPFPSVKVLTLQRSSLFYLEAFYANADELPSGTSLKIGSFMVCSHNFNPGILLLTNKDSLCNGQYWRNKYLTS